MRIAAVAGLTCALVANLAAQNAAQKKPQTGASKASKSASKPSSTHKAPAKSGSKAARTHTKPPAGAHSKAASAKGGKATAKRGKKGSSKAAWRSRQLAPTPDRYKDIQSALATRGYLKQEPNGVWDAPSADALRRFQQDQNLEPSGKLNSLSLIALGLGAKRGAPVAPASAKPTVITPPARRVRSPETPSSSGAVPPAPVQNPSVTEPRAPDSASPTPTNPVPPGPSQPTTAPPTV